MAAGKYGARNHKLSKRAAKKEQMSAVDDAPSGTYRKPSDSDCIADPPIEDTSLSETTRIYIFVWWKDGRLAKFVMLHLIQLAPGPDGWYELGKVDCSDGAAHEHFDDQGSSRNVRNLHVLDTIYDVELAYDDCYDAIYDWRERERKFQHAPHRNRPTRSLPQADHPWDLDEEDQRPDR